MSGKSFGFRGALAVAALLASGSMAVGATPGPYRMVDLQLGKSPTGSRDRKWRPGGEDLVMEVGGLERLPDGRIAVAIRKGEVWILDNAYEEPVTQLRATRFASALHEPLGLFWHGDSLYTAQRAELTRLRDTDGDGRADEYLTAATGWNVSGNYHEYVFGPKSDGEGNLWFTLNLGMGERADNSKPWRGWGMRLTPSGEMEPMCAGMRSPSGLGANGAGDIFYTDQQGNWFPAGPLFHLRKGVFFGNVESLKTMDTEGSPVRLSAPLPAGKTWAEAVAMVPEFVPPAVWFPYHKMGESCTDLVLDDTGGRFGPFEGQFFVGDFRSALINRVFLEKVNGEYQGACFPFRKGFGSAVVRMVFGRDGSLFVGLTNRGWTSVGTAAYGLQRLVWNGKVPFEIKEMRARPTGFELVLTRPADPHTAADPSSYSMGSYTYPYRGTYGGPEVETRRLRIANATVSDDGTRVQLEVEPLRRYYVHELHAPGVRSATGEALLHSDAYYTLNAIPRIDG